MPLITIEQIDTALAGLELEQVFLFGSHASGTATDQSDLDLIVVVPEHSGIADFSERVHWIQKIRRALDASGMRIGKDILVYSPSQWQEIQSADSSFAREIRQSALRIA